MYNIIYDDSNIFYDMKICNQFRDVISVWF